jgi:predicted ATPase with chaperone activity
MTSDNGSAMAKAELKMSQITEFCQLTVDSDLFMEKAREKLRLSLRFYHGALGGANSRITKEKEIVLPHIKEALPLRTMDQPLP